ncbi:MAG: hypothetical protein WCA39_19135 [Nitrososphaeraceae archaeon]
MNLGEDWWDQRNRGLRIALISTISLVLIFVIYARISAPHEGQSVVINANLKNIANVVLVMTCMLMVSTGYGLYKIFKAEQKRTINTNALTFYITSVFSDSYYWKIMTASAIGYGIIFAFLSQIFIYRNDVSFIQQGVNIPSISVTPCCNIIGYVPMLSIYLTDHFLILLVPINIVIVAVVSILVGFNVSLNVYALKLTKKFSHTKKLSSLLGSVGLTSGLFIGCPTCAGSLFSLLLGFWSGAAISILAYFQTVFIVICIPALIVSTILIAKQIRSIYSCR